MGFVGGGEMVGEENQHVPGWTREEAPEVSRQPRNLVQERPEKPTRIVCIGGGTGLPTVLKGLARRAMPSRNQPGLAITAVVAMSDDGGSSGRLRRTRGVLPPGDVRNCLVALAGTRTPLSELFQFRFGGKKGLAGHAVGNLLIAALAEKNGDFLEAVRMSGNLLGARGEVLPCTTEPVQLVARLNDGAEVVGERNLARAGGRIAQVRLEPRKPPATAGLIDAIMNANLITLGPGSLYSSLLPNLLVDGVAEALRNTRALKVLVANLMSQPGETDGMTCVDHVRAVQAHAGPVVDAVLVNGMLPDEDALGRYAARGAFPVKVDRRALIGAGVIPVEADLLRPGRHIRHDSRKLARCLMTIARWGL